MLRALLAILFISSLAFEANAQSEAERARAERELRQVIFSSTEISNGTVFLGTGFKRAFRGSIDEEGFIMMNLSGAGATPEVFEGPAGVRIRVARVSSYASMMLGYQWMRPGAVLTLAAGPEIANRQTLDERGRPRWQPRRTGGRFIAEAWLEPRPRMMAQATLILTSAQNAIWSRAAAGYALRESLFLGPEAGFFTEPGYREMRAGAHLTGLTLGPLTLRLNGGVVAVTGQRAGYYVGLGAHLKR